MEDAHIPRRAFGPPPEGDYQPMDHSMSEFPRHQFAEAAPGNAMRGGHMIGPQ
jgi:hypothetical protein